jgi:hypothetical protein
MHRKPLNFPLGNVIQIRLVADDESQRARPANVTHSPNRLAQGRLHRWIRFHRARRFAHGVHECEHAGAISRRRKVTQAALAEHKSADAIAAVHTNPAQHGRNVGGQHRFKTNAGSEVHHMAAIEQYEYWPLAFFAEQLGMNFSSPRRYPPINRLDVIARLVNAGFISCLVSFMV